MGLRQRPRRLHRLDDGGEPQHEGHRDGQRHQQPGAHHRQHRPRRGGAVLHHRAMQRDGHTRGGIHVEPARLPCLRVPRRPGRARLVVGHQRGPHPTGPWPCLSRHHRGGPRTQGQGPVDHRHQSDCVVPQPRGAPPGARRAGLPGRAGRLSPDADIRVRAPGAARGHLGREGRDVYQLGAAREPGQSCGGAPRRRTAGLRHLPGPGAGPRRARRAVSRVDDARRRLRGVEARVGRTALRLLGHELRGHRAARGHPVAVPGGSGAARRDAPPVHRRALPDRGRPCAAAAGGVGTVPRTAHRRLSARAQHRPHGRALAHAHQDGQGSHPRASVPEGLGRDEPARCARAPAEATGPRRRGLAARAHPRYRAARDRNGRPRPGVRPLPLRGGQRKPGDAERVRPDLARAELQAVGRSGGGHWPGLGTGDSGLGIRDSGLGAGSRIPDPRSPVRGER